MAEDFESDLRKCGDFDAVSVRPRSGGLRVVFGAVELVVGGLSDEVDAEGHDGDAESGEGVAELVGQYRVLAPLVPPLEELARRSQRLRHGCRRTPDRRRRVRWWRGPQARVLCWAVGRECGCRRPRRWLGGPPGKDYVKIFLFS